MSLWIDLIAHTQDLPFVDYKKGNLYLEEVCLQTLAQTYGTPCYVYSKNAIAQNYHAYTQSFSDIPHRIFYAVKANSNLSVLKLLHSLGAGFDVVSQGELARVLQVSDGKKVVYSGVGKTYQDIAFALQADIDCFNVEAFDELDLINEVAAKLGKQARISIRINPDVDAKTHPYISTGLKENKFGIDFEYAHQAYLHAKHLSHLKIVGIDCHIGSQLTQSTPFVAALDRLIALIDTLKQDNIVLSHIDLGGGLGVRYVDEACIDVKTYAQALLPKLKTLGLTLYLEPGRNIVANAGILLSQVTLLKPTAHKNFAIMDASMAEMLRPTLYEAVMAVIPCNLNSSDDTPKTWTLTGSVCESSDVLAKERLLALQAGDLLAMTGAGAYGFSMASNYNSRPRPCEVMVDGNTHRLIRKRESLDDLWHHEVL